MQQNRPNRLITQSSPYLLQHAYNPVDWHPWGDEALQLAKDSNRPILLSIGYSSCHWCHVMEHECFENSKIAEMMNSSFVCIKVDREERPDLDEIYMEAVQMIAGQGGWPMTVFLTPDCHPFYAGTYFPPTDMYGRPGFPRVLKSVSDAWATGQDEIVKQSQDILEALKQTVVSNASVQKDKINDSILNRALAHILDRMDTRYGGVGQAPKFPMPSLVDFLLRSYIRTGNETALREAQRTLTAMSEGGIFDQLGGGFHRYSTDSEWLVPHFEKMLYDNAQLVTVYLNAYRITGMKEYLSVVTKILDYVMRDMQDSEGGFYSAQDADSEGEEGKFYVWKQEEIESELDELDAKLFITRYGVTPEGNFESANILHPVMKYSELASAFTMDENQIIQRLNVSEKRLLEVRESRNKPLRDDKVITSWSSMMLEAFAEAGACLNNSLYLEAAQSCADFLIKQMVNVDSEGKLKLFRTWRLGRSGNEGTLEDYAAFGCSLITLYETTGTFKYLEMAKRLARTILEHFGSNSGGYYSTSDFHERLIIRPMEWQDGAIPSGNALTAELLLRLSRHLDLQQYADKAAEIFEVILSKLDQYATSFGRMLCTLEMFIQPHTEITILGEEEIDEMKAIRSVVYESKILNKIVTYSTSRNIFNSELPLISGKRIVQSLPTVYICRNFVCSEPITSLVDVRLQISS